MVTPAEQRGPELLLRRNQSALRFEPKAWKDSRAWLASCIFHTLVLVLGALLWSPGTKGTMANWIALQESHSYIKRPTEPSTICPLGRPQHRKRRHPLHRWLQRTRQLQEQQSRGLITNLLPSDVNRRKRYRSE